MRWVLWDIDCGATLQHVFLCSQRWVCVRKIFCVKWILFRAAIVMLWWIGWLNIIVIEVIQIFLIFGFWMRIHLFLMVLTGLLGSACTHLWQFLLIELLGSDRTCEASAYRPFWVSLVRTNRHCWSLVFASHWLGTCSQDIIYTGSSWTVRHYASSLIWNHVESIWVDSKLATLAATTLFQIIHHWNLQAFLIWIK